MVVDIMPLPQRMHTAMMLSKCELQFLLAYVSLVS